MKLFLPARNVSRINRLIRTVTAAVAFGLLSTTAFPSGGIADQTVDFYYNLHDTAHDMVNKSVSGVGDAMREAPASTYDSDLTPFTLQDLQRSQQTNSNLYNLNKNLADQQQKLLNIDAMLLQKLLPPNDPRRAELTAEMAKVAGDLAATRASQAKFENGLLKANKAVDSWQRAHDPNYVTPKDLLLPHTDAPPPPQSDSAPPAQSAAPTDVSPQQHGGDDLNSLKQKEAALQSQAVDLNNQRNTAIQNYLNDPSPANRAVIQSINNRLNPLVDQLNQTRDHVDNCTGTTRKHVHVKPAKQVAESMHHHHMTSNGNQVFHDQVMAENHPHNMSSPEGHHHQQNMSTYPPGMGPMQQKNLNRPRRRR